MKHQIKLFYSEDWKDYELLDTGEGEKLERFGKYIFVRPYEEAFWKKTLSEKEWNKIDGKFWSSKQGTKSGWVFKNKIKLLINKSNFPGKICARLHAAFPHHRSFLSKARPSLAFYLSLSVASIRKK